jgi:phosphoribosylaminoimidazole-succinocarboxamide synthase
VLKKLVKGGMPTHYRGIVNRHGKTVKLDRLREPSNVIEVDAVRILRPEPMPFGGARVWNYNRFSPDLRNFLIPLECVFRFGLPTGSSLLSRLKSIPDYHTQLGLSQSPKDGEMLPRPVVELFSKLEPADRHLPYEWALNASGLSNEDFVTVYHYTLLLALFLRREFEKAKVTLWDGKFEFVHKGQIALGDAITADELRLTMRGVQLSKEPVRQYYRKHEPKFVAAMNEAKKIAAKVDRELSDLVNNELKSPPPPMNKEFLAAVVDMYVGLTEAVCGTGLFGEVPSLTRVMKVFERFGIA